MLLKHKIKVLSESKTEIVTATESFSYQDYADV
ncbi:hypothetical protein H1P_820005 [Hyella patelloides LEGE 07179]|uniref:Uncharacterized protein n=1 Tax=Hyella patelloides LEGE 07179 TaxID=945734 RepID=A0A563W4G4_9CYAN|nr:hypothetical protein H1P_820005 [Hyella patelloides LEGE 07179]